MNTYEEMIAIIEALRGGKEIEIECQLSDSLTSLTPNVWFAYSGRPLNFDAYQYRIVAQPPKTVKMWQWIVVEQGRPYRNAQYFRSEEELIKFIGHHAKKFMRDEASMIEIDEEDLK